MTTLGFFPLGMGVALAILAVEEFADAKVINNAINQRASRDDGDAGMDFDSTHERPNMTEAKHNHG